MKDESKNETRESLESLLGSFFLNISWPAIRNLIQELVTPEKIKDWKDNLKRMFISLTTLKMSNAGKVPDIESTLNDELYEPGAMPAWITSYTGNILNEFSTDVARALNEGEYRQVKVIVGTASVVNLFEIVFWKFIHQILLFNTDLTTNTVNFIKDKLKEQLKLYLEGEISLLEAKNAVLSFMIDFNLENEFILGIVVSYMRAFYELIDTIDIEDINNIISNHVKNMGEHEIHENILADDEQASIDAVIGWFMDDFLTLCIKSIKVLYPELTNEKIEEWMEHVEESMELLLAGALSLDDFNKRILSLIKSPKLEFDIEKGVNEEESAVEMTNITNRGSIIQAILSCAGMIHEEHRKDPLMRDLLVYLQKRKIASDMLYF